MKEQWKWIKRYKGRYKISNRGKIKSIPRLEIYSTKTRKIKGRIKKIHKDKNGYLVVKLCKLGKEKLHLVHRLMLEAFVGPCPPGKECRHLDGNPNNCDLRNLKWGTRSKNMLDRVRHGTSNRGEQSANAKLTNRKINKIRILWSTGKYFQRELGDFFGVSQNQISQIVRHKQWNI